MTLFKSIAVLFAAIFCSGCVAKRMPAQTTSQIIKYQKFNVLGGYRAQEVGLHFRTIHPALKACHQQAGSPVGRLVFQFEIRSADGVVMNTRLLDDQGVIKHEGFRTCAVKAVQGLKYHKMMAGNNSLVTNPVSFPLSP